MSCLFIKENESQMVLSLSVFMGRDNLPSDHKVTHSRPRSTLRHHEVLVSLSFSAYWLTFQLSISHFHHFVKSSGSLVAQGFQQVGHKIERKPTWNNRVISAM